MSLYERFTFRGKTLDRLTIAALLAVEKRLGYEKTILQGSYNSGVSASAGTHDGGGALDLTWYDIERLNRAMRKEGCFAGWPRPALPNVWGAHYHGILIGNDHASAGAKSQVADYRAGRNGLASHSSDAYPYRPKPVKPFVYKRAALISWKRVNGIARNGGKARVPEGARQVEVVARALRGFGMNLGDHAKGRMDKPLLAALERFKDIRHCHGEVDAPLNPKTCYELCIPTREDR